jgi:hypothetical protein
MVQPIPSGEDVTVPFPPPLPVTVSVRCGVALIVMPRLCVSLCPLPSWTRTVKLRVCAVVGVPLITPDVERLRPAGRLPLDRLQLLVPLPPIACSVWL